MVKLNWLTTSCLFDIHICKWYKRFTICIIALIFMVPCLRDQEVLDDIIDLGKKMGGASLDDNTIYMCMLSAWIAVLIEKMLIGNSVHETINWWSSYSRIKSSSLPKYPCDHCPGIDRWVAMSIMKWCQFAIIITSNISSLWKYGTWH